MNIRYGFIILVALIPIIYVQIGESAEPKTNNKTNTLLELTLQSKHQEDLDALIAQNSKRMFKGIPLEASQDEQKGLAKIGEYNNLLAELNNEFRYDEPKLISVLIDLSDAYKNNKDFAKAILTLEHAIHNVRIRSGLHTIDQVPLWQKIIAYRRELKQFEKAHDHQKYIYFIKKYQNFNNIIEIIGTEYEMAAWYLEDKNYEGARFFYKKAIFHVEKKLYSEPKQLLIALKKILDSYKIELFNTASKEVDKNNRRFRSINSVVYERTANGALYPEYNHVFSKTNRFGQGTNYAKRILKVQQNNPNATKADVIHAHIELADWLIIIKKPSQAIKYYKLAISLINEDINKFADLYRMFLAPRPISALLINPHPNPDVKNYQRHETEVHLQYSIDKRGLVHNIKVLNSKLMDIPIKNLTKNLAKTRYQPRFEADIPVNTTGITYILKYFYWKPS